MNILNLTPQKLRQAADIQERIQSLQAQLSEILQIPGETATPVAAPIAANPGKGKISAQGLANIRAGVVKRVAMQQTMAKPTVQKPAYRPMSDEQKARLSAIAKARWKKARRLGKSTL